MAIALTADQRNALRDQVVDRLSGIGDVWMRVEKGDLQDARRLGEEYADDLRLLNEGLGWEVEAAGKVELDLPAELLERALSRHCHLALMNEASEIAERADLRRNQEINQLVIQTCSRLLAQIKRRNA